jgi:hypothetical protein
MGNPRKGKRIHRGDTEGTENRRRSPDFSVVLRVLRVLRASVVKEFTSLPFN